jgi:hypothetical protein
LIVLAGLWLCQRGEPATVRDDEKLYVQKSALGTGSKL